MKGKTPVNVGASVRARLLKVSKERHEDFTLMLMNYAAERFLYRLSRSSRREQFVLKGAMLFAVRIGELYRPTRDLDLLGVGEHSEAAIEAAIRDIVVTPADDDGVSFDLGTLQVHPIREDNRYGGIRAIMEAQLTEARIHVQIDVGFGDAITPAALDLDFPTLLANMPAPNVLAYPTETIVAEKVEAMVELGRSNSRMKDFTDLAMAARRIAFDGDALVAAIRATFRRRHTPVPDGEIVALTEEFTGDERAQANWRAFSGRNQLRGFESLERVVAELQPFLLPVIAHARTDGWFGARWNPGGPWLENSPTPR
jgi:predicted nucleotidyltransferase component of viral defense system